VPLRRFEAARICKTIWWWKIPMSRDQKCSFARSWRRFLEHQNFWKASKS
jgi:hypothetical protein